MSTSADSKAWLVVALVGGGAAVIGALTLLGVIPSPFHKEPASIVQTAAPQPPLVLHYGDAQGMYLVPVQADAEPAADPAAWARAVFERLRTPAKPGLVAGVAPDHELVDAAFAGDRWTLTVKVGSPPGSTTERMLVGALVRTFVAGWPGAKEVQLKLIDAQDRPLASQHLDLSAALTPADVANTAASGDQPAAGAVKATVWWPEKDGGALVPVTLDLKGATGIPPRDAFERLLQGPPAEAGGFLGAAVPAGAKPSWAALEDGGVAAIDLAGDLPPGEPGRTFIEAAVLTLTEFPDVKAVRFTRAGQPIARQVGPFHLDAPVGRPAAPNGAATAAGGKP